MLKQVEIRTAKFRAARANFQHRLSLLRSALEMAQRQQRREAIEALSASLRQELLRLMEASPRKAKASAQCSRGKRAICRSGSVKASGSRAGLWTIATPSGKYHAARLTIGGVVVVSRATRCLQEAARLQESVQSLGLVADTETEVNSSLSTGKVEKRLHLNCAAFEHRFKAAVAKTSTSGLDLGLTFRLVLDLRPWVGKKVQSPTFASLEAALSLRKRVLEASSVGWPALRSEWIAWMSAQRPRGRWRSCTRSRDEAEAAAAAAEEAYQAERKSREAKRQSQKSCKAVAAERRMALRMQRAARRAEAALARLSGIGRQEQASSCGKRRCSPIQKGARPSKRCLLQGPSVPFGPASVPALQG
mmetsp:Transcript_7087/g.12688  ORF Transcript_7087/g.12688 Transcript_7087/m.12688 type:complete len:362 (+) Transcript_7087:66-1151(+)